MKKILSLLIVATMMLSVFAGVVSAAEITSANKATLTITVEEEETPSSAAQTYATDTLFFDPDTYTVYKINIVAGNLPGLTKASNTSYTGDGITAATMALGVTSSGDWEIDWGILPVKGSGDWNGTTYDWYAGNETTLLFGNVGVVKGASQTLTCLEVVVLDGTDISFTFNSGTLGAAVYNANRPNQGTGFYSATAEIGNLTIVPYPSAKVDVTSVTISGATSGKVGDEVQLSATVLPDNATNPAVTWTKVSGAGAVSSTGVVTATAAGDVVVKATADDVDSANYTVTFAPADVVVAPTEAIKTTDADTTGLTDLKGNPVTLTKKYGIAKFSTDIDTVANNYFLDVEAEGGEKTSFAIDFDGIEISATTSFYAIVRSATRVISSIKLRAVAN